MRTGSREDQEPGSDPCSPGSPLGPLTPPGNFSTADSAAAPGPTPLPGVVPAPGGCGPEGMLGAPPPHAVLALGDIGHIFLLSRCLVFCCHPQVPQTAGCAPEKRLIGPSQQASDDNTVTLMLHNHWCCVTDCSRQPNALNVARVNQCER